MPQFLYTARDAKGHKVKGKVEAKSRDVAANVLREKKLFIISLQDHTESSFAALSAKIVGIKQDDIVNITRQLATMINAGLPLIQSFTILETQAKPALKKVLRMVIRDIESGSNLGTALKKHPTVFTRIYVSLVEAGEAAGALDKILNRLADTLEKQKEFRAKTKGALIYPGIVFAAMIIVMIVMLVFVIPQMTDLYADFGADLPMPTQILIGMSNFLRNSWYVFLGGIAGAYALLRAWKKTESGRFQYDKIMLKVPVMGQLRQKMLVTEFSRTMSLMITAGISLLHALEIVRTGLDNELYRRAVMVASEDVEKGKSLSSALERQNIFPILLPQMVAVGEETGQLDDLLTKLSVYYEAETEHAIKNLTTAMEPVIMVVLGVGVGFLIIAIIMPI
jgi:type IV pilus assembly protein PilC